MNSQRNIEKSANNSIEEVKNVYKIPDNYSTLQSMSEIRKCVDKISSLQKVLKDSSSSSKSSFDQVDRSINISMQIISPTITTKDSDITATNIEIITDGKYFLEILKLEQSRLIKKSDEIEVEIKILTQEEKLFEDVLGLLRSTSGKARLLASQKMKQFEGLCYKNINQTPNDKFQTTNEDLQGFWDMVKLQIDHVDSLFKEIEKLKSNNWILEKDFEESNISTEKTSRKTTSKITALNKKQTAPTNTNGAQKQDFRRKELMELKRKAKSAMQNRENDKSKDSNKLEFFF